MSDLHVRWGLDPGHRRRFGVPDDIEVGTWRRALDRLLLGVALPRDDVLVLDGALPEGVEGSDVSLLGRLTDLIARCAELAEGAGERRRVADRLGELRRAFDQLLAPDPEDARQSEAVTRALSRLDEDARRLPEWVDELQLDLAEVRALVVERLGFAGRRSAFFTGGVTITSLGSLRGVPFRVVCLLGLDEASLPAASVDGDDLTNQVPFMGDPDRRAEARRSLLAAVAAAGEHLVVLHDDRDVSSNAPVPASVVLHELLEAIGDVVPEQDRAELLARVAVRHPRQATDATCFGPDTLGGARPWSFDPSALRGARARMARRGVLVGVPDPLLADRAGGGSNRFDPSEPVETDDLRQALVDPAKFVCRRVLDVQLPRETTSRRPLTSRSGSTGSSNGACATVDSATSMRCRTAPRRMPSPPSSWRETRCRSGCSVGRRWRPRVGLVDAVVAARRHLVGDARPELVRIAARLPEGRALRGELSIWRTERLTGTLDVSVSRRKAKDDLGAWLDLLLLAAAHPGPEWQAVLLRIDAKGRCGRRLRLSIDPADAPDVLTSIVALLDVARCGPIPFFPDLSKSLADGKGALALAKDWATLLERDAPAHFLYGGTSMARLLSEPSRPPDPGEGPGRAERLAATIWGLWADTTIVDEPATTAGDDR